MYGILVIHAFLMKLRIDRPMGGFNAGPIGSTEGPGPGWLGVGLGVNQGGGWGGGEWASGLGPDPNPGL